MTAGLGEVCGEGLAGRARLVVYHKQSTSARTRFLRVDGVGVCLFGGIPADASVAADQRCTAGAPGEGVTPHPAPMVANAERLLGLPRGMIEMETGFLERAEAGDGQLWVYLARVTTVDPPFEAAATVAGRFVDLVQARDLPQAELELLRRAYCHVLGG